MSLTLVKTTGGVAGSPEKCASCGGDHFVRSGLAWSCGTCGFYVPANFSDLRKNLSKLQVLHGNLKSMIDGLERLVQEVKKP